MLNAGQMGVASWFLSLTLSLSLALSLSLSVSADGGGELVPLSHTLSLSRSLSLSLSRSLALSLTNTHTLSKQMGVASWFRGKYKTVVHPVSSFGVDIEVSYVFSIPLL